MEKSSINLRLGNISLVILPEFGGRIANLKLDGCAEWISQPSAPLVARNVGDNFIRPEISGWDEMVPTTDACRSLDGLHDLPDHGEVWSQSWRVEGSNSTSAAMSIKLSTRTLELWRKVSLVSSEMKQSRVTIEYRIANVGKVNVPAFWSSHPLFSAANITQVQIHPKIGLEQTTPPMPLIEQTFLPQNLSQNTSVEYWCKPETAIEKITLTRSTGEHLSLSWDKSEVPYFGIFVDNQEYAKEMVISPQPAIAHRVSERNAEAAHRVRILKPKESFGWSLRMDLGK